MNPLVVTDVLAVGEFPTVEQLEILARAGFKSIINTQPDGEVARFPSSEAMAGDAARLGLASAHVPIESRRPEGSALAAFADAARRLPDPIYAFCYSGARAAAASAFLMAETRSVAEIVAELDKGGYDVRALIPWLQETHARHRAASESGEDGVQPEASAGSRRTAPVATVVAAPAEAAPAPAPVVAAPTVVYPRAAGYGGFAM